MAEKIEPARAADIAANLRRVRERIERAAERAGRRADEIAVVAVSKTFPAEAVRAAYAAGLRDFGENRVQELSAKRAALGDLAPTWHFIGHLQSNKVRLAAELADRIDSVDSLALAQKLDAATAESRLKILLEVHLGGEATKSGVSETDLPALASAVAALPNLDLRGLMAVPPYSDDPAAVRPFFRKLHELRDALGRQLGRPLPTLSMGMSHDFEIAIEEGSTEVRIGTALFGTRPRAPKAP